MNLYGLIVFHHVAATGSVTKAAEALRISQPAVTAHVRNMAAELGLTLLAPKGRGIFLTEAGERLAAHAARLFALQAEAARDMSDLCDGGCRRIADCGYVAAGKFSLAGEAGGLPRRIPERGDIAEDVVRGRCDRSSASV